MAHSVHIFTAYTTTYYCHSLEEALRRAKKAGKKPGCFYGGITLRSEKKGFAIYQEGKVVEQYSFVKIVTLDLGMTFNTKDWLYYSA